ncbi:helicase associated domain-containing protein [Arthrobacter sp. zg-Y1110]|uniref:helicase associated domain-containing protein n=1 Tax=Arthrobacter sp. zg-Y1110 TaxID=2886932 RepID=UPI001D13C04C|nr:helicase associated domain-containing protein [Arthrobacter sp. zg-Y1110]MCC3292603.1 helicase associated domain-containing protein [Arthrobacter sp. zg-Y1110]UWX86966.1 helicase associated domain-containing protein [Arthrobacter sp. zg-Y1110]
MPDKPSPMWHDSQRWLKTLEEVAAFRTTYGVLPGDSGRSPRERALQQWLKRQGAKAIEGALTDVQVKALDLVDGDWRANQTTLSWENNLAAAILDYQERGRVPGNEEGAGPWLLRQRSRMAAGKLTEDQVKALDEAIPGWRNLDRIKWSERAKDLARYVTAWGRFPSSRSKDPEGLRLYTWLAFQRKKLRQGRLDGGQVAELNDLVPGWRGRNQDREAI